MRGRRPHSSVAALPGGYAGLVAFRVGQYPERRGLRVVDQPPARLQGGLDARLRLVVRHRHVEVDAVALRARRVHPLEPDSRALTQRVDQPVPGPGPAGLVGVIQHRPPERPDRARVERVDPDLEHLHRPAVQAGPADRVQPELGGHRRDPPGQLDVPVGDPARRRGLQGQHHPVRAHVHPQVPLGAGHRRHPGGDVGGQRERSGKDLGPQFAQDQPPPEAGDGVRGLLPGQLLIRTASLFLHTAMVPGLTAGRTGSGELRAGEQAVSLRRHQVRSPPEDSHPFSCRCVVTPALSGPMAHPLAPSRRHAHLPYQPLWRCRKSSVWELNPSTFS